MLQPNESSLMQREHWKIADMPWGHFDASKIDAGILAIVKAAALVEVNAHDYASYLCNVFPDDPGFHQAAKDWSKEETQHGEALGMWAERADASFNFRAAVARYTAGYKINVEAHASIRGSHAGEL